MITGKCKVILTGTLVADAGINQVKYESGLKDQVYFLVEVTDGWGDRKTTIPVLVKQLFDAGKGTATANALTQGTTVSVIGFPSADIYMDKPTVILTTKRLKMIGRVSVQGVMTAFVTGSVFKTNVRAVPTGKGPKEVFEVTVQAVDGFGDNKIKLWVSAEKWYPEGSGAKIAAASEKDKIVHMTGTLVASEYQGKARLKMQIDEYEFMGTEEQSGASTGTTTTPPPPASSAAVASPDDDLPF